LHFESKIDPDWRTHNGVNLSIKNVPEELARQLRERARRHHRSLQGELMAILEEAVWGDRRRLSPEEVHRRVKEL